MSTVAMFKMYHVPTKEFVIDVETDDPWYASTALDQVKEAIDARSLEAVELDFVQSAELQSKFVISPHLLQESIFGCVWIGKDDDES